MQPTTGPQQPQWPGNGQTGQGGNEDTGYAPELRAARSRNLYRRDLDFWQQMTPPPQPRIPDPWETMHGRPRDEHYDHHPQQFRKTRSHEPPRRHVQGYGQPGRPSRPGSHPLRWLLCILLVLAIAGVVTWNELMYVETITVEGNQRIRAEEIIELSGLQVGMNRLAVKEDEVTQRIEQNRYLICELVHLPDWHTVHIRVSERYAVAAVEHSGMVAYTDLHGMVLEKYVIGEVNYDHLVRVNGMLVNYCETGMNISLRNSRQLETYNDIMLELRTLGVLSWFRELNLNSMDSIYLVTRDGYTVHIGTSQQLHEKLRAMMLVVEQLRLRGSEMGTVDVTSPANPSYIPDSVLMIPTTTMQSTGM